jgi:hypothetical protein
LCRNATKKMPVYKKLFLMDLGEERWGRCPVSIQEVYGGGGAMSRPSIAIQVNK